MTTTRAAVAQNWTADPDFDGRLVDVLEYDRPANGSDDAITAQSIGYMLALANRDAHSKRVRAATLKAVAALGPQPTTQQILDAVWNFAATSVYYQHEAEMRTKFSDLADFNYDQTLIAPAALLAMPRPHGDCVDFSALVLAMCRLLAIPASYKTIAAAPDSPNYSHVYVIAEISPGNWYALDASNGPGPGYEFALPRGKKSRIWPDPSQYGRKRTAMIHRLTRQARQSLSTRRTSMGDLALDDNGQLYDTSTYDPGSTLMTGPNVNLNDPALQIDSSSNPPSSSGIGTGFTKIATSIINDATAIAAPLIRQSSIQAPYYITGANGAQILYDPSTGKVANAGVTSGINAAIAGLSPSFLLYAALGFAAVLALSSSDKK